MSELPTAFKFPTGSEKAPTPTDMEAVPDVFAVGVKVAVYVVPEPVNVDSVPPVVEMSPATKFDADSESVNVIVDVCPAITAPIPDRVMVTVGAVVSTVCAELVATAE